MKGLKAHMWLWVSGIWTFPLCAGVLSFNSVSLRIWAAVGVALLWAPIPAILVLRRSNRALLSQMHDAEEDSAKLRAELETVKYRTARLREELQAADRQAQLSHQLTLLGQFTAGFLHEFNNPLAIVVGRIEVLLEERREDAALCADLEQMLKEARYMGKIATTLLQALRRERSREIFEPCIPQKALADALKAIQPQAVAQGIALVADIADAPRVDVPEHVVAEVARGLLGNALQALKDRSGPTLWLRVDPYRTAGATVVLRVEDNGPGVPERIRAHLFEPFISESNGRERLGLGLFLAASLLDMYDGRIRYEPRPGGGASFIVELPPTRFTRGQPYHWLQEERLIEPHSRYR
jgi:signal transduction histidine kinase